MRQVFKKLRSQNNSNYKELMMHATYMQGNQLYYILRSLKAVHKCSNSKKGGNMDSEKLLLKTKCMV